MGRTVLLAGLTLALLVAVKRWAPRAFSGALVAVALGIALSRVLDLEEKGVAVVGRTSALASSRDSRPEVGSPRPR